jgi:2-phospho-L-lactate transferase/gluconeogenesis factor (CofD/UPF0052 family)
MNLMTKMGQTSNYTAADHIKDLTEYLGRAPDIIIMNNGEIDESVKEWYNKHNEHQVTNNLEEAKFEGKIVTADLVDRKQFVKNTSDQLTRSILRHDSDELATVLHGILV